MPGKESEIINKNISKSNKNILVAVNNKIHVKPFKKISRKTGLNSVIVSCRIDGFCIVDDNDFCIAFIDTELPYSFISDLSQKISNNCSNGNKITIIAIISDAGYNHDSILQSGFNDYIFKPVSSDSIMQILTKYSLINMDESGSILSDTKSPQIENKKPSFSENQVINIQEMKDRTKFPNSIIKKLFKDIDIELIKDYDNISKSIENKNLILLKRLLHALKGKSANFCFNELYSQCILFEKVIKDNLENKNVIIDKELRKLDIQLKEKLDEIILKIKSSPDLFK